MNTVLLIDGNALVHRAFHALPDFKTSKGIPTNAVYGFATMLHRAIEDFKPSHIAVCFDTPEPTFRDKLYEKYRIQRPETAKELTGQFPLVLEMLKSAGIVTLEKPGLEADDLLAIVDLEVKTKADKTIIITGDRDILQLVDKKTIVATPQIGFSKSVLYDPAAVEEKFGVTPKQIADYKALAGDPSDNYPGVAGIGPKTASQLIRQFGSVEKVYKNLDKVKSERVRTLLEKYQDDALMGKQLAKLVDKNDMNITLEKLVFSGYDEKLLDFFEKLEFGSLKKRFFRHVPTKNNLVKKTKDEEEKKQIGLF